MISRNIYDDQVGELLLVFRVVPAAEDDIPLKDIFGRPIMWTEGFILRGQVELLSKIAEKDFQRVRTLVEGAFREFWNYTTIHPVHPSSSFILTEASVASVHEIEPNFRPAPPSDLVMESPRPGSARGWRFSLPHRAPREPAGNQLAHDISLLSHPQLVVKEELDKRVAGQIVFNPLENMKAGIKERIEVRIAKGFSQDVSLGLRGHGEPRIEDILVGTFMAARLSGDNFDIRSLGHDEQLVAHEGFTEWVWDIVPLTAGVQILSLIVTFRIKLPNAQDEVLDYPAFEREIAVRVSPVYSTTRFVRNYWQWIVSTAIGSGSLAAVIGWTLNR